MTGRAHGFWALCLAGIAIGGTGVWVVALAARVGILRMLLEIFPRPAWETVTWGLIPAVLLAPPPQAAYAGLRGALDSGTMTYRAADGRQMLATVATGGFAFQPATSDQVVAYAVR